MRKTLPILCLALLMVGGSSVWADVVIHRDVTYELDLRYEANPDKVVTPARFFNFVNSLMGHPTVSKPSNIEFQPIVNIHDDQVRVVGAIAYKF